MTGTEAVTQDVTRHDRVGWAEFLPFHTSGKDIGKQAGVSCCDGESRYMLLAVRIGHTYTLSTKWLPYLGQLAPRGHGIMHVKIGGQK